MSFDTIPKDTVMCDFTNGDRERLYRFLCLIHAIKSLGEDGDPTDHIKITREHFGVLMSNVNDLGSELYCDLMERAGHVNTWGKRKAKVPA